MDLFILICMIIIFIGLIVNAANEDRYMLDWREYEEYRDEDY